MNTQEQLQYRRKLIDDAVRQRKVERVPHLSGFFAWPVLDYGLPLSVGLGNWDLYEQAQRHFLDTYQFDAQGLGITAMLDSNPHKMIEHIGTGFTVFNDAEGVFSQKDVELLHPDEYDELIADPLALSWNKLLPRKYERWANGEVTVADFKTALDEYKRWTDYSERIVKVAIEEYGLPSSSAFAVPSPGIEMLYNWYRGFRGTSLDLRKMPDKVFEVAKSFEIDDAAINDLFAQPPAGNTHAFDATGFILAHNFLSLSQWDKYEWPFLKKILDAVVKADATIYLFAEGVISRFYDYFKDFPPGHIAIHIEQDDVFDFRKNLPNIAVIGGMPTSLLGGGTPKQCVDYAKHLCDELGPDGGFILSQNKMMTYKSDTKPENIKAVCDFVAEYTF